VKTASGKHFCSAPFSNFKAQGFDVPAANVVISYDHLKDTVELCQRFGRARQKTSLLTLMSERKDRPLSVLKDVKTRQESIIKGFDPTQNQNMSMARQQSIRDRERAAFSILKDTARCEHSPLECLNMFCAKTKAVVKKDSLECGPDKLFRCKLLYSSISKNDIVGSGEGTTKKQAQHLAATNILNRLREINSAKYC
jgi:hypothetical protein